MLKIQHIIYLLFFCAFEDVSSVGCPYSIAIQVLALVESGFSHRNDLGNWEME